MKALNFKQTEQLKKQIAVMTTNELNRYLSGIYIDGFNDAKEELGVNDGDIFVWSEEDLAKILKKNHIAPWMIDKIIKDIEA